MAELAVRTNELIIKDLNNFVCRPVGSVIISISYHMIRRKWLEIICDLVSPKKRDSFRNIPGWQYLVDHWTPALREEWLSVERQNSLAATEKMLADRVDGQLSGFLGKDPRQEKDLMGTWLWSEAERKRYFLSFVDDESEEVIGASAFTEVSVGENAVVLCPSKKIDFETALGLSQDSVNKIKDPGVIVHPKFSSPISKTTITTISYDAER